MAEVNGIADTMKASETRLQEIQAELQDLLMGLPNLPQASVPAGHDETCNVEARRWGTPPPFDFAPQDHVEQAQPRREHPRPYVAGVLVHLHRIAVIAALEQDGVAPEAGDLGFMRGPLVSATPVVVRVTLQSELRRARSSRAALAKHHRVLETVQWLANILLFLCVCAWLLLLCFQCQPIPKPSTNLHLRFRLLRPFWIWRTVCLWTHQAHFPIFQ
jgi:hypothetical protein